MTPLGLIEIPSDVRLILGGIQQSLIASVYVNEKDVDFVAQLGARHKISFQRYSYEWQLGHTIESPTYDLYQFDIRKIPVQDAFRSLPGTFFILNDKSSHILYLFSIGSKRFINKCVHSFMEDLFYPGISRAYLTSTEIFRILEKFESHTRQNLYSRNASGKAPFSKNPERTYPETVMRYGTGRHIKHFAEQFTKAVHDDKRINWLEIENHLDVPKRVRFDISRDCNITLEDGGIDFFFPLLHLVAENGITKSVVLKNLQIQNKKVTPILLDYDLDVLSSPENRVKLLEQLRQFPNSTHSIIHGVNPHIYVYMIDRRDGTSFSIRNIGFSKILITPQSKANYGSLLRFINYLVEHFMEFKEMKRIE